MAADKGKHETFVLDTVTWHGPALPSWHRLEIGFASGGDAAVQLCPFPGACLWPRSFVVRRSNSSRESVVAGGGGCDLRILQPDLSPRSPALPAL